VILFPGTPCLVIAVAVEFDGKPVLRPAAVDVAAAAGAVRLREGQAGSADGGKEGGLELAQGDWLVSPDDVP
jgi:hypothetical protein